MSHRQTWRLSQDAGRNSGECSVCHAVRQLHLKDGTVHQHGPRDNRCLRSGKPPAISHVPPPQHSSSATATGLQPSSPDTLSQSQVTLHTDPAAADDTAATPADDCRPSRSTRQHYQAYSTLCSTSLRSSADQGHQDRHRTARRPCSLV